MSEEKRSSKTIQQFFIPVLVILAVGLAFFSGTLWQKVKNLEKGVKTAGTATQETSGTTNTVTLDVIKEIFSEDLIKFGDAKREVLFVEMADPSCPYCHVADGYNAELSASIGTNFKYVSEGGTYVPPGTEIQKLVESGKASYVYIYYPGHGNGEMAMKALYCAQEKGKFWQAKNLLMTDAGYTLMNTTVKNDKTKSQTVADFLKGAVDATFMKSCLDSGKYDARLISDQDLATSLGIQGTPSFYVNSTNFPGAYSYTDMQSAVDAALK
jgi:protein-disulfide isomerase